MAIIKDHAVSTVNVLAVGVTPGTSLSSQIRLDNTTILQQYADRGYSLYFPGGQYELGGVVNFTSQKDIKIYGDAAVIYQTVADNKIFFAGNVDGLEVFGLHMHPAFFLHRTATAGVTGKERESAVHAKQCSRVQIHHNTVEGYNCWGITVEAGDGISVCDNTFKDGQFTLGDNTTENTCDLRVSPLLAGYGETARDMIVCRNYCNTQSLVGIMAQRPTRRFICKDNYVICRDAAGNDIRAYQATQRKAGIEIQYYTGTSNGATPGTDDEQYQSIIEGNHIEGCRYAGITGQSNPLVENNAGGHRGPVKGNVIRYCGTEQTAASDRLVGGIVFNQYRDIVISGNVIKGIEADTTTSGDPGGTAAILVQNTSVDSQTTGGTASSCIIDNNEITDCRSRGIWCFETGDVTISNNQITDVEQRNIWMNSPDTHPRHGKFTIIGNRIKNKLVATESMLRTEGTNSRFKIHDNEFDFSAATVSITDGIFQIFGTNYTLQGNTIVGNAGAGTGLNIANSSTARPEKINIADNSFVDLALGIIANTNASRGPIPISNCSFSGCTENIRAADVGQVLPGAWAQSNNGTTNQLNVVGYSHAIPTAGNWIEGDIVWNQKAVSGQPMGWICTTAGVGAGALWTAFANVP